MKRFYKEVSLRQSEDSFLIELDGKPVKTPAGQMLKASKDIAPLLAREWAGQVQTINPLLMPVNQLVMTAMDGLRSREEIISHILSFIDTDLVFYRSETEPYKEKQAGKWDKWIALAQDKSGIMLKTTGQIELVQQDKEFAGFIQSYLENLDQLYLIVFESLVDETSSPVLALAMFEKKASAEDIFNAVLVEDMVRAEIYEEELYGAAPDQEKKRQSLRLNLDAAECLTRLT
ncbi:MAG: hypothetical protein DI586_01830 [Micavibrio aeruginosavorus]|uniref:ATP12 chaperone family protein n=1 Tax=Micavibrio aeruginosavorus TaxID=349221 RepID=A0A2W5FPU2_9BACT|nr:MAG: hypothetical protein DI586_01830 [Micavibrio aeruginosavorus]